MQSGHCVGRVTGSQRCTSANLGDERKRLVLSASSSRCRRRLPLGCRCTTLAWRDCWRRLNVRRQCNAAATIVLFWLNSEQSNSRYRTRTYCWVLLGIQKRRSRTWCTLCLTVKWSSITNVKRIVTGSIARSATSRHLNYSEADFEFFAPQERHVSPMGWNLAWIRGPKIHSSVPNFTPIGATVRVYDPKNEIFTDIWSKCEYKRPAWAYTLRDIYKKIAELVPRLRMR